MLPDIIGRGLLYGVPVDGNSVGNVFESDIPESYKMLMAIAAFQSLALYLLKVFQRKEFSKHQWNMFLLFGIPVALLSLGVTQEVLTPRQVG